MKRGAPGKPTRRGRASPQRPPELPLFICAIHGRVGKVVYKTYGRGKHLRFVKTRVACFEGYVPTVAQRARRDRMREATAFAQRVYSDPAAKALYVAAAQKLGRQPFRLAVADYLRGHDRDGVMARLAGPEKLELRCQAQNVKNSKLKTPNSEPRRSRARVNHRQSLLPCPTHVSKPAAARSLRSRRWLRPNPRLWKRGVRGRRGAPHVLLRDPSRSPRLISASESGSRWMSPSKAFD
jgi:hypothetical protein